MTATNANPRPLEGGQLWLAAVLLAAANFIAVLDMTIANVSVPSIAGSLGISSSQGTWVITSYSVAEACIVPLTGWIAGRFGAVRVFATAMVLFGVCSMLCGLSPTLGALVVGRVLQGLSGGSLMPLSQTLLMRIFPKEKTGTAMAIWAMTTVVAPVLGPILGGWLCDSYSWPLIFFVNVPITLVVAPVVMRLLRSQETTRERQPVDRVGLVLLIVFVSALQLMLDLGKERDWFESNEIAGLAIVAAVGFAAFLIWELTEAHPIVDLRVFRHRGFAVGVITISLGYGAMFGANVLTPLWLQSYMGYTATWAGRVTAWSGVLAVVASPIAGRLTSRVDPRPLIFFGLAWLGGVMVLRTVATTQMGYWQLAWPLILMGVGLPFFFVPITALSLGSVEPRETASAAGLQNFMRTLSGAVATSLVQTGWENHTSAIHADIVGSLDQGGEVMRSLIAQGFGVDARNDLLDGLLTNQSVMLATNQMLWIVAGAFFVSALAVWLAPRPTRAIAPGEGGH